MKKETKPLVVTCSQLNTYDLYLPQSEFLNDNAWVEDNNKSKIIKNATGQDIIIRNILYTSRVKIPTLVVV